MKKFTKMISVFLSLLLILQAIPLNASALESLLQAESTQISQEISTELTVNEPYILSEDISKREENVKHFKMSDGTYQAAVYAEPVHYYEGGQWIEYDNTIKFNTDNAKRKEKYTANVSDVKFSFPDIISAEDKIRIKKNGHEISFGYKKDGISMFSSSQILTLSEEKTSAVSENKAEPKNIRAIKNGALKYKNVSDSTDIEYELSSSMLKENIIVSGKQNEYVYSFNMDIGELTPVTNSNGSISLIDENNGDSLEYVIVTPFMTDAKGIFSNQVSMSLSESDDEYILTVTADKDWLNAPDREFPVTIDPTLLYKPDRVDEIFDTYVDSGAPNASNYWEIYSIIGYNVLGTGRAYLKFNLPSLPHCGVITNAQLYLIQLGYDPGNGVTNHMAVYESPSPQNYQTLTWNNQPSLASQSIVDYTVFRSGNNGSVSYLLDITKIAKKWFENGINNGLFLTSVNENSSWRSTIYTSNYDGYDNYPMILISYIDNKGLEDYWSYETIDMGRSGTAYINQYNGLLTYVHTDINLGGNVTSLTASHIYSNDYKDSKPYGYGFRLSAQESITVLEQNAELYNKGYRAYLTDADGTAHYFKHRTDNEWYYEFDDSLILVKNGNEYELQYEDGSKRRYDSAGRLLKIIDRNGNTVTHMYDGAGRIYKITDDIGRSVTYTYGSDGYLSSMKDAAGRNTTYTYSGGYLDTITYPDGKTTELVYISKKLFNIIQADSTYVFFMYQSTSSRVNYVSKKGTDSTALKHINLTYNGSNTVITDSQGRHLTVGFDNMGRAVSYTDKDGNSSTTEYNTGGNKNNTVAAVSDTFSFSNNLLKNHSFENGIDQWSIYLSSEAHAYSVTNEKSYVGSSSLMLSRTQSGMQFACQDCWYIWTGRTYTFSVYIKTENFNNCRAGIHIEGRSDIADLISYVNGYITESKENGWTRLQVQYTVPEGVAFLRLVMYLEGDFGTAYFDATQLEEASSAGHYNLLENPGFDRYSSNAFRGWTTPAAAYPVSGNLNNTQSAAISGSVTHDLRLVQSVNLGTSSKERTLVFGGTAKGECAASSNAEDKNAKFSIILELYSGSTLKSSKTAEYNAYAIDTAQLIFDSITADTTITSALLYLIYDKNVNTAYFDDIFLYIDNYGTTYEYDSDGKLIMQSNNAGDAISYEYRGPDIKKISVKKDGVEKDSYEYEYDSKHNILKETTKDGIITEYSYPASNNGMPTSVTVRNANGTLLSSVSYIYVLFDNYTRYVTDARGKTVSYFYISSRDLLTSYTDANGNETQYEYNSDNDELIRVYSNTPDGNFEVVYSTNSNGYLSSITQGGVSYDFTYDVFGRRTSTKFASQTLASYTYNSRGLLSETTYGNGATHTLTYDTSDRVISEAYDGTTAYSYSYNTEGYLGKTIDHSLGITTYYNYDLVGRVTDVDSSDGVSSDFSYNEYNSIERYSVKKNNSFISGAGYIYNSDGLLSEVFLDSANGAYFEYNYDSLNRLTRKSHSLGGIPIQVNYSYLSGNGSNTTGLVSSILYSDSGYRYMPKLSYTYDANGNILTVSQNDVLHISYTYDSLNRLIREDNKDLNQSIEYTYDTRGNILNKKIYAYTTGTLGSVTDTINYTYSNSWKDKLYTYDGQGISYDSIGNPTSYRGYTLTWQKGRQLASLNTGSKALSFKYDINGLRTEKKVDSTTYSYLWSSGLLMQQSDGTNTLKFSYSPDGKALEVDFNGNAYYYIYNLQGDVIGLYNTGGSVVVEYTYDSWGKLISTIGSLASTLGKLNPFRYRGYIYDDETGLYYLRSRYYDPETGRFLNSDGYVSTGTGLNGFNMFAYCNNNPVCYSDSEGNRPISSTSVSNETKEDRKISCRFEYQQKVGTDKYVMEYLINQTKLSINNSEIIASLDFEKSLYTDYLEDKSFVKEYSSMLNSQIIVYNAQNDFKYEMMNEQHIYSELLAHYHIYKIFDNQPTIKTIWPFSKVYDLVKSAEMNYNEKRGPVIFLMAIELIDY